MCTYFSFKSMMPSFDEIVSLGKSSSTLEYIFHIQDVTKKKPDCINHALGTMPIDKPLAHHETQLISSIVLQFL